MFYLLDNNLQESIQDDSWYTNTICEAFICYAAKYNIDDVFCAANYICQKRFLDSGIQDSNQVWKTSHTLTKPLFFFPN